MKKKYLMLTVQLFMATMVIAQNPDFRVEKITETLYNVSTMNIEKKKQNSRISRPSKYWFNLTKPVIKATRKIVRLQSNMAFRLCATGPGESVMLTQSAPSESVKPMSKWPSWANKSEGTNTPNVMRKPSEKYWLNKKYWISRAWFFMLVNETQI